MELALRTALVYISSFRWSETAAVQISLIIPAFNEERYIGECLRSVIKHAAGRLLEIIVVDNASTDRTAEIAASYPGVRVVHEPHKGVTRAKQRGLQEAKGAIVAFVDADNIMSPGWIEAVEQTFIQRTDVACLSGPYLYHDGPRLGRKVLNALGRHVMYLGYLLNGHMLVGGNFAAKKSVLEEIGGFDPTVDFWGEDSEIGRRIAASKKGKFIYRRNFNIGTSARRFVAHGYAMTSMIYGLNYHWVVLFHRPFSNDHANVRIAPAPDAPHGGDPVLVKTPTKAPGGIAS